MFEKEEEDKTLKDVIASIIIIILIYVHKLPLSFSFFIFLIFLVKAYVPSYLRNEK